MSNFFSLVKVQFLSYFGINKVLHSGKKSKTIGTFGALLFALIFASAFGFIGYVYSEMFATSLSLTGEIYKLIPLMVGMSSLVAFAFSFYASSSAIYGFKDYEMISAMPVKTHTVVLSKVFFSYVADLLFTLLIIIPSLFVYKNYGGVIDASFIISMLIISIVSPFFPFALSTVIGALVTFISSRFKRKNLAQIILLVLIMVGFFALSMLEDAGLMNKAIEKIYFIFPLCLKAFSSITNLVWFSLACISSATVVIILTCLTYRKMNTLLSARKKSANFKLKQLKTNSPTRVLLVRELKRLTTAPTYLLNTVMGAFFTIVAGVSFIFVPSLSLLSDLFIRLVPAIFGFMFILSPTTSCSLSIEGETFWIIKTMPVSIKKLINVKLSVNLILGVIPAFISSILFAVAFNGVSIWCSILVVLCALSISLLGGNLGMIFNILLPMMKWDNINKPVKQGGALLLTMLCAFVFAGLFGVGAIYLKITTFWILFIAFSFTIVLNIVVYLLLMTKGEKLINQKT